MANNLFQQLNNTNTNPLNLLKTVCNSSNPSQMLNLLANNNPALKSVLDEVKANGGDAKSLFYKRASQMGINPNSILNQLK